MSRSPAGARFDFVTRWDWFALARGVGIAAFLVPMLIWLWDLNHDLFGPYDWGNAVYFAFMLNKPLAVIETCASIWMAIRARARGMPIQMRRHLLSVAVRACCGVLPVLVFEIGHTLHVPDRCYLARHMRDLLAVVNGADPEQFGFMDVYRLTDLTVIQAINLNISDCYWVIYSPDMPPSETNLESAGGLDWGLRHATRVQGPWYAVVF